MSSCSFDDELGTNICLEYLAEEAKMAKVKTSKRQATFKRSRSQSVSPAQNQDAQISQRRLDKKRRIENTPSIELIEDPPAEKPSVCKQRDTEYTLVSSSPVLLVEPPVAWPPANSHMTTGEVINKVHSAQRARKQASLNVKTEIKPSKPSTSTSLEGMAIHPSLNDSDQATLKCQFEKYDDKMQPLKFDKKKPNYKRQSSLEIGQVRDQDGNLLAEAKNRINKKLLTSLGQDDNAITNSDLYSRTQHIISAATGHQVSNRGGAKFSISGKDYFTSRNQKLKQQFTAAPVDPANANVKEHQTDRKETFVLQSKIFAGCTMWLNGYSGHRITDMELKKLIAMHGGNVSLNESYRLTHVLVSERLSGNKADKFLKGAKKAFTKNGKKKVVLVDWVLDSIEQGRKLGESAYSVIKNESQPTIVSKFSSSSRLTRPTAVKTEPTRPLKPSLPGTLSKLDTIETVILDDD